MNNISLKQNEDFMKDVVTPTMLQKQQIIQKNILQVVERREKLAHATQRAQQDRCGDVVKLIKNQKILKVKCSKPKKITKS